MESHQTAIMQMISAGASRVDLIRHFASLTPEQVLNQNFASLSRLKKEEGAEKVEKALAILLMDASRAFEAQLNSSDATELAIELHSTFYYFTLEDCFIVLQRMKHKHFFGKLTLNKILSEFATYNTERMTIADGISYNQHLAIGDGGTNRQNKLSHVRDILKPLKRKR